MPSSPAQWINVAWVLWLAYWAISALRVKPAVRVESTGSRWGRHVLWLILAVLMLRRYPSLDGTWLNQRFVPDQWSVTWLGLGVTVLGLGFACWARVILGRNWSGIVQLKQDHELIVRGPYSLVRHPIYTGLLLAFFGTALAIGEWHALIGVVLLAVAFWRKLRLEECWLCELFGEQYRNYMRHVKALVPWVI
ncbi:methyltransferase family protein [Dyella nitratireducens]|uniref:Protein-S-isoprenylcysteine methyltransferase n=1 Tax=Dyella nitratireducens TaxID=1849580 RepID=A0ABQ1GSN7_9GAMM|nr:isoprenylcysteine carboxylmethyltransferase family protein [Dyella nitratireducens]GGA49199.1 protein-S-isoprenylcysteine methyltransferase [Dyella nitratireducens]GLQ42211.1 protein-S-isoprenylcysteine methyltransferase [Dyella nitratireducens]